MCTCTHVYTLVVYACATLICSYFTKSHHYSDCDAACKESRLCAMRSARSYDPDLCGNLTAITYLEHLNRQFKENLC